MNVEGADSRVSYDGSFKFEKGDVVGALLMDENNTGVRYGVTTNTDEWKKLTWLEKYHLVDYIHTDYPFVYDGSKFNANCNMLEGNYFLTYPYTCQAGNRQVKIDFADQTQIGQDQEARKKFVAEHQRFIGYAQLKAGEGVSDFTAQLQPILAPVRFGIKSEGNVGKDLHITKVVVSHSQLKSTLTVDPTRAKYGEWNLTEEYVEEHTDASATSSKTDIYHFNYANFLANQNCTSSYIWGEELYENERFGSQLAEDYVYNVADGMVGSISDDRDARVKSGKYYWDDAIRSTVVPMDEINNPEYDTRYVEVKTWESNATPFLTLKSNETVEVIMMLPAIDTRNTGEGLNLTIYTQEGIVKNIDLSKRHNGSGTDVITTGTLEHVDPINKNIPRIEVILDNPAIIANPENATINNGDDLLQIVKWINSNPQQTGDKEAKLSLTNDIVITDEIAAEIEKLRENYVLTIETAYVPNREGNNLKINTSKEHANVLEHMNVLSNVTVEVMPGAVLNMTDKSYNIAHEKSTWEGAGFLNIEVAKGGLLNIDSNDKHTIQGGANSNGQPMPERTEVRLLNMGTVEIYNDTKVIGFYFVNEGEFNVRAGSEFYFAKADFKDSQNTIRGTVNVDKGAQIAGSTQNCFVNYGTINNAGKITNIRNYANGDNKKPGLINILNDEAYTDLSEMTGMIDYNTHLTGVHFNNTGVASKQPSAEAIFKYTHAVESPVKTSALTDAWVTDADIVSGKVITDIKETTLRNLVMEEGTTVAWDPVSGNKSLIFDAKFGKEGGFLTLKSETKVDNVEFFNVADEEQNILLEGRVITFTSSDVNGVVGFYKDLEKRSLAGVYMNKVELTVNNNTTVNVENLKSVNKSNSQVNNYGEIFVKSIYSSIDTQITININDPKDYILVH
ncbi:MAG: hypothetical protein SOX26_02810 [Phocaeicola sp.]|nr:hypothetical protein [Phocaeicola sp.]